MSRWAEKIEKFQAVSRQEQALPGKEGKKSPDFAALAAAVGICLREPSQMVRQGP